MLGRVPLALSRHALVVLLLVLAGAPALAAPTQAQPSVRVSGEIRTVAVDRAEGPTFEVSIELEDGTWLQVEPDRQLPATGTVTGTIAGDQVSAGRTGGRAVELHVQEVVSGAAASPSAGSHRAYLAYVTSVGSFQGLTPVGMAERVESAGAFWVREADGSIPTFTVEDTQPLASQVATAHADCGLYADYNGLWAEGQALYPSVDFDAPGNHLVVLVADECQPSASGMGTVGSSLASGGAVVMRIEDANHKQTLAHEFGHNVGLRHAQASTCPAATPTDCTSFDYGDFYDVMAGGVIAPDVDYEAQPALNSVQRRQLGLLADDELEELVLGPTRTTATATYVLHGRGSESGLRTVAVPDPEEAGRTWFIEYRDGAGRDAGSLYTLNLMRSGFPFGIAYQPGVTVLSDTWSRASQLWTTPRDATLHDGARTAGQTFTSPSGTLTVQVGLISGGEAEVTVTIATDLLPMSQVGTPSLTGEPVRGAVLDLDAGAWPEGTDLEYRWLVDGTLRAWGDHGTWFLDGSVVGHTITGEILATKDGYRPVLVRTRTIGPVAAFAPPIPSLGTVVVGRAVKVSGNTWPDGTVLTYEWLLDGLPAATGATFTPTPAMLGRMLSLVVTGAPPAGEPVTATSASRPVEPGTFTAANPRIMGQPRVGSKLRVAAGHWPVGTTLSYQWYADGRSLRGRTQPTLKVGEGLRGERVRVTVTGKRDGYRPATGVSKRTGPVR